VSRRWGAAGSPWEFAGDHQASDAAAHDDDVMRTRHYAFRAAEYSVGGHCAGPLFLNFTTL
jgi:hypothetical protein